MQAIERRSVRRLANGAELTLGTTDRAELSRANFTTLVGTLHKRPEPVEAFRNFQRARSTSYEQHKRIENIALSLVRPEHALNYLGRELVLACEHIVCRPDPMEHLDEILDAETFVQADGDVEQRRLPDYVRGREAEGLLRVARTAATHETALVRVRLFAMAQYQTITTLARGRRA